MSKVGSQKLVAVGVLLLLAGGAIAFLRRDSASDASDASDASGAADVSPNAKEPRLVLSRPWFDHYPKTRAEEVDLWWFSSGGIGIHDRGSVYRATTDFFEFERQGAKLDVKFLHDKKKQMISFEVVACDDKPPFDLCLDVKEPLRGKKRFYSFAYDDELDQQIPWARAWRASAEARTRTAR